MPIERTTVPHHVFQTSTINIGRHSTRLNHFRTCSAQQLSSQLAPKRKRTASHHVCKACACIEHPTRPNPCPCVKLRLDACGSVVPSHHVNASWAWPFSLLIGNRVSMAVRQRRYLQGRGSQAVAAVQDSWLSQEGPELMSHTIRCTSATAGHSTTMTWCRVTHTTCPSSQPFYARASFSGTVWLDLDRL